MIVTGYNTKCDFFLINSSFKLTLFIAQVMSHLVGVKLNQKKKYIYIHTHIHTYVTLDHKTQVAQVYL